MACKICDGASAYELTCENGCGKAAELCNSPLCQFDLWRVRPNEPPSCIPLMNGKCHCGANLQQVLLGNDRFAYRFNNANRAVFRTGYHTVEEYRAWEDGSQIVKDARLLRAAWEARALNERESIERPPKEDHECSGIGWNQLDEGMDVATEIANVKGNSQRDKCTLWRAVEHGSTKVIGILIMWNPGPMDRDLEFGIRWLVGHPDAKGAGEALMAQANALHRQARFRAAPMTVISARSSVSWYRSQGFALVEPCCCEDGEHPCGCQSMAKPAPSPE